MSKDFWEQRGDGTWKGDSLDALSVAVHDNGRPKNWLIITVVAVALLVLTLVILNSFSTREEPAPTPEPTATVTPEPTPEPEVTTPPIPEVTQLIRSGFAAQWSEASIAGCRLAWTAPSAGWSSILVENKTRAALTEGVFSAETSWGDDGFTISGSGDQHGVSSVRLDYTQANITLCAN